MIFYFYLKTKNNIFLYFVYFNEDSMLEVKTFLRHLGSIIFPDILAPPPSPVLN